MIDFLASDTNQIILAVIIMVVSIITGQIIKQIKQTKEENEGIRKGVKALLRTEILKKHKELAKGGVSVSEFDNIQKLYKAYINLGGNGTVDKLMKEVKEMPTKEEKK